MNFTGKNIEVTVAELTDYVTEQLDLFDKYGDKKNGSPYSDPIIYTTSDNRTIMVPADIQKDVVSKRQPKELFQETINKEKKGEEFSYGMFLVLIIVGFIVGYLLYKSNN